MTTIRKYALLLFIFFVAISAQKNLDSNQSESFRQKKFCRSIDFRNEIDKNEKSKNQQYIQQLRSHIKIKGSILIPMWINDKVMKINKANQLINTNKNGIIYYFATYPVLLALFLAFSFYSKYYASTQNIQKDNALQKINKKRNHNLFVILFIGMLMLVILVSSYAIFNNKVSNRVRNFLCSLYVQPSLIGTQYAPSSQTSFGMLQYAQQIKQFQINLTSFSKINKLLVENFTNRDFSKEHQIAKKIFQNNKDKSSGNSLVETQNKLKSILQTCFQTDSNMEEFNYTMQFFREVLLIGHSVLKYTEHMIDKNIGIQSIISLSGAFVTYYFSIVIISSFLVSVSAFMMYFKKDKHWKKTFRYFGATLWFFCFIGLIWLTILSIALPVLDWGCDYVQFIVDSQSNMRNQFTKFPINKMTPEYFSICMGFGHGNISRAFNATVINNIVKINQDLQNLGVKQKQIFTDTFSSRTPTALNTNPWDNKKYTNQLNILTLQQLKQNSQKILAQMSPAISPMSKMNCSNFGRNMVKVLNSLCINNFNSLYEIKRVLGVCCLGIFIVFGVLRFINLQKFQKDMKQMKEVKNQINQDVKIQKDDAERESMYKT